MHSKFIPLAYFIIAITVICAFAPAVKNDFINWDDNVYITENIHLNSFSLNNIKFALTSFLEGTYQPIINLTYLIEHHFFDLKPSFYHATNILLHLLNCFLVFRIFLFLECDISIALLTSLLFGIHPLRVESVAWVTERKDVLYSLFFLWSLFNYCLYVKKGSKKYYYRSLLLFLLSLASKAMAVTLPLVFFVTDYFLKRKFDKKVLVEKIPFFILAFIFGTIAIFAQGESLRLGHGENFVLPQQICAALYGIIMYLYKTFVPVNLSLIYPYPAKNFIYYSICLLSAIFVLLVILSMIFSRRYTRKIIFGFLFAFVTILPVSQLIPVGTAIMADRYAYLPSVSVCYLISLGLFYVYRKTLGSNYYLKAFCVFLVVGFLITLSFLTYKRSESWKDSVTIFSDVIKKYPQVYMAYNNRGAAYQGIGKFEEALADFEKSIQLDNSQFGVYNNLGTLYYDMKMPDKAITMLTKAISIKPDFAVAFNNLGNSYSMVGRSREAIDAYNRAIQMDPNYAEAYNNLGTELLDQNEAIKAYEKALEINPHYAEAYYNLSKSYQAVGKNEEAAEAYRKARSLNPNLQ